MKKHSDLVVTPSRRWRRWLALISGGLLASVIVLAGVGATYQAIAGYRDRRAFPPPGRLVDVGGFRMHLYCMGEGSPTVVLDSGLSDTWLHWYKVQPKVAKATRVCAYDRAGLGWSDTSPRARSSRVIAEELHALLQRAGIAPPFVLVGHSMGGLDVRMYASLYRQEVAGMVLVDASHPDQFARLPSRGHDEGRVWRTIQRDPRLMFLGLTRMMGWCGTALPERADAFRAFDCSVHQKRGANAEEEATPTMFSQVRGCGPLGGMPLVVVSEDPNASGPQARALLETWWMPLQDDLARLSSRSSHVVAPGSGHQIHLQRPDVVIEAVLRVVADVRSSTR